MNLRQALRGLRANRLRSALAMLGIIIGVAAVILLVALGNGVRALVDERIQPLANLILIMPSTSNVPGGTTPRDLTDADVEALQKPELAPDVANAIPAAIGQTLAATGTSQFRSRVVGSTERWLELTNRSLEVGSFFDKAQTRSSARVVVLGSTVSVVLFGTDPVAALNRTIRIDHQAFKVIGVQQPVGQQLPGDNDVVMPLNTARQYIFGSGEKINEVVVQATRAANVPAAVDEVTRILSDRHGINEASKQDFEVQSLLRPIDTFNQILRIVTLFIACTAAISLLVGSVGVLNIMLVSVSERTRENRHSQKQSAPPVARYSNSFS